MKGRTPSAKKPPTSVHKPRRSQHAVLGAVCALVIGLYAWNAKSGLLELWSFTAEQTYYNLLAQGFRSGQLNLKREVPSGLAQLADPYDPVASSPYRVVHYPLEDLSYYQGKLHLYFGATPALLLFWPYAAATGHYVLHKDAAVIFCAAGFLASVGVLWTVWRRYFGGVGIGVVAACALALGLANFKLAILQRCDVYEVAISCGYALTMVTLALVWQAMHATHGRAWWLAGASLAYGLAVGARPSLLCGAVILLVPVAAAWREMSGAAQPPQRWTVLLAAAGPITLIGLGLMLYNFLRFDHPLEFGQSYQLNSERMSTTQQFSLRYFWFNLRVGFLEPARWSAQFPFVQDIALPPLPKGAAVEQLPFGILSNIPLVWLALTAPLVWRGRLAEARSSLQRLITAVVLLVGTGALIILLHNSMTLRYQVEFLPPLVLLAVLGIFGLERALAGRPVWRQATRWGWGLALAFSVAFNCFAMLERSIEGRIQRGVFSIQKGLTDEAGVQFEKALALQPDNAEAHHGLGVVRLNQDKVAEAIGQMEEAIRLKPDLYQAHSNLGEMLCSQGKLPEAIGHLEEALRLKPNLASAHSSLGYALFQLGKVAEGIGHLEQALQLDPGIGKAHYNLGVARFNQGNVAEAVGHLEQALRLEPDDADARKNLAVALTKRGEELAAQGKWDEAIQLYQRAVQMRTNYAPAYERLGAAFSEAGCFEEAVQASERGAAVARATGNNDLAALIESRLKHYREGRAYHAISERTGP